MVSISEERFAELIVAEHHYNRLCRVIKEKANTYDTLDNQELRIIRDIVCPLSEPAKQVEEE